MTLPPVDRPLPANASAAWGIPIFYAVAVLARTSVIVVIPTLAFRHLENASLVSAIYFIASIGGLLASTVLPAVLKAIGPWWLTIGASLMGALSGILFTVPGSVPLTLGLASYFLMVQLFETVSNIYALNMIPRRSLARFEPRRIMLAGVAYGIGPMIGTLLLRHGPEWSPFAISAACALLAPLVLVFLVDDVRSPMILPVASTKQEFAIKQFLRQPRLRIAWVLAIGRAAWWQVFFVYTPILVVAAGYDTSYTGAIAGIASGLLLLSPIWGMFMRYIGLRRYLTATYAACGIATAIIGLTAEWSFTWAIIALMFAALAASGIDSAGNAPFLRSVRKRDRLRMVPIYNTYREISQIIPAAIFTIVLMFQGVSQVFLWVGLALVILSFYCKNLPRRA
ncbi:MFS transporter [Falsochrobactrum sp. TDYN1]|uniref:MFS transporter n=1 Tax=Falsochrobactrum tianjinense TaxID=2706015 RepID=A0A949PQM9_9HYPH|nr:MFS transporter [Falsochrobactrum sp. TDYN1]MBV2144904.1 MFS transporter [Falsochrobactrum sp. TDYN1]